MSTFSSLTHHANLFVYIDRKNFSEKLWGELRQDSPAHVYHDKAVFDIDSARALISWAQAPYNGKKIALISFHTITLPAQNALLKILEEPKETIQFILVTSNKEALIPTLYSRVRYIPIQTEGVSSLVAQKFLATSPAERMKLLEIGELLSAVDEENRKDREGVKVFILSLATLLGTYPGYENTILTTLEMASYAGDPSASVKMILEYLSLTIPQIG